jgi:hypothetical protein
MRKITLSLPEDFFHTLLDLAESAEQTPDQLFSTFLSFRQTEILNQIHDLAKLQRKTLRLIRKRSAR